MVSASPKSKESGKEKITDGEEPTVKSTTSSPSPIRTSSAPTMPPGVSSPSSSRKRKTAATSTDNRQWLTYWILYSMITLIELTFAKVIEWPVLILLLLT
ncbi:hypothetical protein PS2_003302 [Malus domestica]